MCSVSLCLYLSKVIKEKEIGLTENKNLKFEKRKHQHMTASI